MKKYIIAFNFISLVISTYVVKKLSLDELWIYIIPLFIAFINCICFIFLNKAHQNDFAKTFAISSLLILLIGGSSCVSIKFKQKQSPQKKKPKEIKRNIAQELDFFQYEYRQA